MAETPRLVTSMGKAEHDRIFVRGYDLNEELLGKISFAQMVCLMLTGKLPTTEQARMIGSSAVTTPLAGRCTSMRPPRRWWM